MVFMVCRFGVYGGGGIPAGKPQGTVALRGAGISGAKLLRKNCNRVANIDCMQKKNYRPVRVETLTKQTWSMTPIMANAYIKRWRGLKLPYCLLAF